MTTIDRIGPYTLGQFICHRRAAKRWGQKALAHALGISPQYLCDLEAGRRDLPGDRIAPLAFCLDVSPDVLWYLCRRLPPDVGDWPVREERIVAAFAALRKELQP